MRTLVIVPAFNEEANIQEVIHRIRTCFPGGDILVINDGSTDGTGDLSAKEGALVLEHPYNMGIGATVQSGLLYAMRNDYDIAIQTDGDGQHNPEFLSSLIEPLSAGRSNLVIGSRYLSDGGFKSTPLRKMGITFFIYLILIFTRRRITDPTSGFRAMDRKSIALFAKDYPSDYPEVEALLLAHRKGLRFEEVPVRMGPRRGGTSSIGFLSAVYYMVKVTLAISIGFFRGAKE